jgi:hypothetical protein
MANTLTALRKFSVTHQLDYATTHYLIEAKDREAAEQILEEELGPARARRDGETIEWSTHATPTWRSAWRHGDVKVVRPTTIPDDIE